MHDDPRPASLVPPRLRSQSRLGCPNLPQQRWTRDRSRARSGARLDDPAVPTTPWQPHREHTVVEVRRDDHEPERTFAAEVDRHLRTMIATLTAGDQQDHPSGWRRFVPRFDPSPFTTVRKTVVDWRRRHPPRFGALRRVTPIDPNWGFERGTPIDRIYVDRFIGSHAGDIRGRILEIAAPDYTTRFGTGVEHVDILMATEGNPQATIVGDLTSAPQFPTTASTARSSRRPSSSSTTYGPRSPRCIASSRPEECFSRPCPDHEDLAARGRGLGRVVALHRPIGTAPCRGGVRRGQRRRGVVRQRLRPPDSSTASPRPTSGRTSSTSTTRCSRSHRHPCREARDLSGQVAGAARRRASLRYTLFGSRCSTEPSLPSSSSSRRWSLMTSASPSTAASTAYSASSTSVGSGNVRAPRSPGMREGPSRRLALRRRQPEVRERVAQPRVDDEPSLDDAVLELFIVDHERPVVVVDRAGLHRLVHLRQVPGARPVDVRLEGGSHDERLPRALLGCAQREVERLDRIPATQRSELGVLHRVVPPDERGTRICSMDDLADRPVQRARIVDRRECGEPHRHALGEVAVAGTRNEGPQERADGPVALGNRREHLLQRAAARPPELVRIGVDHPVGAELGRRETRHASDPLAVAQFLARLLGSRERGLPARTARGSRSSRPAIGCRWPRRNRPRRSGGTRATTRPRRPRPGRGASSRPSSRRLSLRQRERDVPCCDHSPRELRPRRLRADSPGLAAECGSGRSGGAADRAGALGRRRGGR